MTDLTELELEVLDFEAGVWKYQGAKDAEVLRRFGLSPMRYQQLVLALIDRPEAYVHAPMLVKRLRRLRDTRRAMRTG